MPRDEIAAFHIAAGDQVVQGHVERVEMIDQGLARVPVIDEEMVEPWLFERDRLGGVRIGDAARLLAAGDARHGLADRLRGRPRGADRAWPARSSCMSRTSSS